MKWHAGRLFALAAALFLLASGCGQSFVSSNETPGDDGRGQQRGGGPTADANYMLVPAGAKEPAVGVRSQLPLKVFLFDRATGDAISDEVIDFEVISGGEHGSLGARSANTDEAGAATAKLRTSKKPGTLFVEVSHKYASPIEFKVSVQAVPTGDLRVKLVNTATSVMPLTDANVRLYNNDNYSCAEFAPLQRKHKDPFESKFAEKAGSTVEFGALKSNQEYVVTAVARGNRGQIAGGGCKEKISVPAEDVSEEELLLQLVPLNPTGQYEVTSEWDFSEALKNSGVVGQNIVRVLNIFDNPGNAIYNEVMNLVKNYLGGLISGTIDKFLSATGLDDKAKNAINSFIQKNDALCKVREAGRDVRDVVTNLTIHSELTIGALQSGYEFQGRDNWLGITLYWRGNCENAYEDACSGGQDNNSVDARKKPCAALTMTGDSNGELGKLGILSSTWKGRVTGYNRLEINRHPLPLKYGRLIQFVLNDLVIPELTDGNANSLAEAFGYWLGCGKLARGITGSDGEIGALGVEVKASQIEGFCNTAVATLFGAADLLLGELEYDTGITVGGEALLIESNSDGRVDYIEDGIWEGYIEVSGGGGMSGGRSNVGGTWEGKRLQQSSAQ